MHLGHFGQASFNWILIILYLALQSLAQDTTPKQGMPQSVKLHKGQPFKYKCCARRNDNIIFKWGLYMRGSPRDPIPLYGRSEVKGATDFQKEWSKDFISSIYYKRVKVAYDPRTLCMTWTIARVRQGDDNTFHGSFRDDQSLGGQFKPCNTTVTLLVLQIQKDSSTDRQESKYYTIILSVVAIVVFGVIGIALFFKKKQISEWWHPTTSTARTVNPQENLHKRSKKRIRNRRRNQTTP